MEAESEPYVRLATLRTLHRVVADLNAARSLAGTLQAVVEGAVTGMGFAAAAVSLVRQDGDLVVAAVWELEGTECGGPSALLGRVGSRESWERLLNVGDHWGTLRFVPYDRGWAVGADIPSWTDDGPIPRDEADWHPADGLLAPMYSPGGELLGVLSVDRPRSGKRPGAWIREALEMFSLQASIAIGNARLRAEMQRALARLEKEQQALRASEESFRQAFEYAPSGMAITELHGLQRGKLSRVNDALCRLLGRPRAVLRRQTFSELVHPEDRMTLERTSAEGGRAELRISRRDGGYLWVCLRNSVVADASEGPRFLLTHVEDIEDRKRHELQLAHRASHDALTGLPNGAELRTRLRQRLCSLTPGPGGAVGCDASGGYEMFADVAGALSGCRETPGRDIEPVADTDVAAHGYGDQHGPDVPGGRDARGEYSSRGGNDLVRHAGAKSYDWQTYDLATHDPRFGGEHIHAVIPDSVVSGGSRPGDQAKGLAVIFCDLDGFKSINDRFGHNAGDAVLVEVAQRLQRVVREGDTVARLGGDEFVVLADNVGQDEAKDLAGRLRTAVIPPMRVDSRVMRVGVSLGIGWAGCGMSIEEVLHTADELMYVEKRARTGAPRGGRSSQHGGSRSHRRAG